MLNTRSASDSVRDERGFTLMETLMAMLTGVVVTGALFAILEVSMHQSTRIADVVQATQLGRGTMNHIVDELHSACIAPSLPPVQEGSNANELIFTNAYSALAEIPTARKDKIVWNEKAETLTDYTYLSNGGSWPKYTFPALSSPTSTTLIGTQITQSEEKNAKGETVKTPIFQYFAYATASTTGTENPSSTISEAPMAGTLKGAEAENVSSVLVSFRAAPADNSSAAGRRVNVANQVTFAFSAPNTESPISAGPCE